MIFHTDDEVFVFLFGGLLLIAGWAQALRAHEGWIQYRKVKLEYADQSRGAFGSSSISIRLYL